LERDREVKLARLLLTGNPAAFDEFVAHFRAKIFKYTWLMCGQREDAEQVAQDTLLKVFENFGQLRRPERVRPWVFRIAKNVCSMKRRKSIFAPACELSLDENIGATDGQDLPDRVAMRSHTKEAIELAIRELPASYRHVILLRDIEELSTQETAEILDLSEDVVKTRLQRGRLLLRDKLG